MLTETSPTLEAPAPIVPTQPRASMSGDDRPATARGGSSGVRSGGLVLTRHVGESIMIGGEIEVVAVGLRSGTARLKVVAPRSVPVHRREIFDSIRADSPEVQAAPPGGPATPRPDKPQGGLVLARMAGQSIMIGDDVELSVVEVRPSTVKLRISAPKSVAVHRREVFDSIRVDPA
jgi:carbon storage regulator CsrA